MKKWKTNEIQIRDPFVLKDHGNYYLFGSTDKNIWGQGTSIGFQAYKGEDLRQWEGPFDVFIPEEEYWGKDNFWAPEVHLFNGVYYMFATFRGEDKMRGTAILKADNPLGPYTPWSNGPVTPKEWMALDGTLYVDRKGTPWIVFCHEWVQIKNGEVCAMQLTDDLKKTKGEVIRLLQSTDAPWTAKAFSREHNIEGWVTDGPNMYRMSDGRLVLLWSCMADKGYTIGYAISESDEIFGPWKQYEEPLFERDGGHGMVFESYKNQLFLAIHQPNDTPNERAIFIELEETADGLKCK